MFNQCLATAETTGKFLYTRDDTDYMITDAFNVTFDLSYEKLANGLLFQTFQNDRSHSLQMSDDNFFQAPKTQSFAVETFRNENRNSSKRLKHLIVKSEGQIIVRELTEEERLQLEAFKQKRKEGK